jgi:hypothetical protein
MSEIDARMERLRRAARYRYEQLVDSEIERGTLDPEEVRRERESRAAPVGADDMVSRANALIEEGERRGVFADNPYHGKPLPGNDGQHDPDWWIRSKVEREQISGLGPPALMLRKEDAELDDRLDAESDEARVRELVADFDARVVEARRQLLCGPPVTTRVRDVDDEVARWRDRREARITADADAAAARAVASRSRRRWWRRRSH